MKALLLNGSANKNGNTFTALSITLNAKSGKAWTLSDKSENNMKKVIVISTSLRRGSNSDMLADQFIEGAKAVAIKPVGQALRNKCHA